MTTFEGFCKDPFWDHNLLTNGSWPEFTVLFPRHSLGGKYFAIDQRPIQRDHNLLTNGSWPEFTDCFQDTALVWIPCGFLWLCFPFYSCYLVASCPVRDSRNTYTRLYLAKLIFSILLVVIGIIEIVLACTESSGDDTSKITAVAMTTITFILAFGFTVAERIKRFVTSGVLFLFWFLQLVCNIIPFYTLIQLQAYHDSVASFSIFYIKFALILTVLFTHCFAEVPARSLSLHKKPCPESESSFLSRTFFSWQTPLILLGYKKPLTEDVMPDLNVTDKSATVVPTFLANWKKSFLTYNNSTKPHSTESSPLLHYDTKNGSMQLRLENEDNETYDRRRIQKRRGPSLKRCLFKTFGLKLLPSQIWKLIYDILLVTNPLILGQLIAFVQDPEESEWKGFVIALALFLWSMLRSIFFHQHLQHVAAVGRQIRASLISTICRKALTVGNEALQESTTTGEVVNLMSVDVDNITGFMLFFFGQWSSPMLIIVSLYLLYNQVGVAMLSGAAFLFFLIPINAFITAKLGKLQEKLLTFKDRRMKIMNELLSGMKIIKLFAWERSFEEKVRIIRNQEVGILTKLAVLNTIYGFSWSVAPYIVSLVTFLTYIHTNSDHYLDPQVAFVAISLFDVMKIAINYLPYSISEGTKAWISANRIEKYLCNKDINRDSVVKGDVKDGDAIVIKNGTFKWSLDKKQTTLTNINVSIPSGSLVAVVGSVGSGKSSLLSAMLGEHGD